MLADSELLSTLTTEQTLELESTSGSFEGIPRTASLLYSCLRNYFQRT